MNRPPMLLGINLIVIITFLYLALVYGAIYKRFISLPDVYRQDYQ